MRTAVKNFDFNAWLAQHDLGVTECAKIFGRSIRFIRDRRNGHEPVDEMLWWACKGYTAEHPPQKNRQKLPVDGLLVR